MLEHKRRQVSNLSTGQIQRVLVARALAAEPRLLLMDEPTASVDSTHRDSIFEVLRELNETISIVLVSHDIGFISSHVKKIACLNKHLIYHGTKELTPDMVLAAYGCPIDIIAHGVPHRVFPPHVCYDEEES
jgi:zinc transport system ATP-binding protein